MVSSILIKIKTFFFLVRVKWFYLQRGRRNPLKLNRDITLPRDAFTSLKSYCYRTRSLINATINTLRYL